MRNRSNKAKVSSNSKVDTLLGHETEVIGDVRFAGGIHVDGVVKGNIAAEDGSDDAVAIVSERGRVEGELRVPNIIINGHVTGDVYATERLDLAKNARVYGDVHYRTIEMASGAEINGQLVRIDQEPHGLIEHQHGDHAGPQMSSAADEKVAADETGAFGPGGFGAGEKT